MPANLDRTASKLPIDTDVTLPPSIAKAGADADALHRAAYPPAQPDPPAADPPAQPDPPAADPPAQPDPPAQMPPADPPAAIEPPVQPSRAELQESEWARRYNAMKGRWEHTTQTNGTLQETLQEMGDENMRLQALLAQSRTGPREQPPAPRPAPRRHVTDEDVTTYGPELLDTIQRAARDAVAADLENVTKQTRQVSQQVAKTSRVGTIDAITREVPDWEAINNSPRFKQWARLPDVYSGQVRANLLNAAFQAADTPRVVAFFKGFLAEEVATGQVQPLQPPAAPAPRVAAIPLETLTAPGRPKPAGGNTAIAAADKPVITRAQISTFYSNVRAGHYSGRDADKARDEAVIFSAQNEGRVR